MKLMGFSEYVERNPFNSMDRTEGEKFVKQRNEEISRWRKLVAGSIDKNYGGYQNIEDDYFDFGPKIEEKGEGKEKK